MKIFHPVSIPNYNWVLSPVLISARDTKTSGETSPNYNSVSILACGADRGDQILTSLILNYNSMPDSVSYVGKSDQLLL